MEKGKHCSRKDELNKQRGGGPKGHGLFGETSVVAVAEQSEWELALGLQAVGALEPGKQGSVRSDRTFRTGPWQLAEAPRTVRSGHQLGDKSPLRPAVAGVGVV